MELVKVSADRWNFEEADSGKRIAPFGANFVFPFGDDRRSLDIMTAEAWEPDVIRKAFEVAAECHMNLMKVFLPIPALLPDAQVSSGVQFASMTPSIWERLEFLFEVARETGVYVTLSLAEWGMWNSAWFHEGGEFVGRPDAAPDAPDSYRIMAGLWRELARFLAKEPALFSYNLAVELYVPEGNWGGAHPDRSYLFADRWALPVWHAWLRDRFGSARALNQAWGTAYSSVDQIEPPEIKWQAGRQAYTMPQRMIAEYLDFKEATVYRFLKNQTDAIRSEDASHMVTCGFHPDQAGIGPKGFAWKVANCVQRDLAIFDYLTIHLYTQLQYLIHRPLLSSNYDDQLQPFVTDEATFEFRRHECELYARFMGADRPVVAEEFGHLVRDFGESLEGTRELMKTLAGHVSGFQLWSFGADETLGDYAPMSKDLALSEWGSEWRKLAEPGGLVAGYPRERTPARTVIRLDRLEGVAPTRETPGEKMLRAWDAYEHPVDFEWPGNPAVVGDA